MHSESTFQCCCCAKTIVETTHEPLELAIFYKDGSSQQLWVHVDCLGERLHPSVPFLALRDHEDDGD